ncbi:MAG: hypothetical protein IT419_04880 [Planctomycetes bacterium]|nr:hypothetical protein [Planctomycetota bacterium]
MNLKTQHANIVAAQRARLSAAATDEERKAILSEFGPQLSKLNSEIERSRRIATWHEAPDGSPCCCTEDDRRYGCGCR